MTRKFLEALARQRFSAFLMRRYSEAGIANLNLLQVADNNEFCLSKCQYMLFKSHYCHGIVLLSSAISAQEPPSRFFFLAS
jgi:hypothetical protein